MFMGSSKYVDVEAGSGSFVIEAWSSSPELMRLVTHCQGYPCHVTCVIRILDPKVLWTCHMCNSYLPSLLKRSGLFQQNNIAVYCDCGRRCYSLS
jgi:hypothetical protein